ncbi:hypothetical protein MMC20_000929 [Loxospora ochrophaea]|nr:hypothetical protein [Loxospora ochrophaea]
MASPPDLVQVVVPRGPELTISNDANAELSDLTAQATAKYALKDYSAAAELYSRATELQAELNGEMSPENADLLYAYGRCLYHVAVSNSDVLGSKVAGEKPEEGARKPKRSGTNGESSKAHQNGQNGKEPATKDAEEKVAETAAQQTLQDKPEGKDKPTTTENKPYFQFTGDENFDESDSDAHPASDSEAAAQDPDAQEDEIEDDFSNAYEVLDLARLLLQRRLDSLPQPSSPTTTPTRRLLHERLADTYDLQAEISLEGERFPAAVTDLRSALALKLALYPPDSSLLAEAHYKLSLALEFASITQQADAAAASANNNSTQQIDEPMRAEAASEMAAAIASCKARIAREEAELADTSSPANNNNTASSAHRASTLQNISNVREMVAEMTVRLAELKAPPVSLGDVTGLGKGGGENALGGVLGAVAGASGEVQMGRLEEARREARDVSGLVKRKRVSGGGGGGEGKGEGAGKGKAVEEESEGAGSRKKAKPSDESASGGRG